VGPVLLTDRTNLWRAGAQGARRRVPVFGITRVSSGSTAQSLSISTSWSPSTTGSRAQRWPPSWKVCRRSDPGAAAPSSTPSPTTLQRFSRDAPQTPLVGAGCGRSPDTPDT